MKRVMLKPQKVLSVLQGSGGGGPGPDGSGLLGAAHVAPQFRTSAASWGRFCSQITAGCLLDGGAEILKTNSINLSRFGD